MSNSYLAPFSLPSFVEFIIFWARFSKKGMYSAINTSPETAYFTEPKACALRQSMLLIAILLCSNPLFIEDSFLDSPFSYRFESFLRENTGAYYSIIVVLSNDFLEIRNELYAENTTTEYSSSVIISSDFHIEMVVFVRNIYVIIPNSIRF